jgi:hypothetical protein
MTQLETVIAGTIQPDGSLVLDEKPNLPPGRVQVVVQVLPIIPSDDPFWQRMQAIRAIPRTTPDDGGNGSLEEVRQMREEWDEQQRERERLQGIDPS